MRPRDSQRSRAYAAENQVRTALDRGMERLTKDETRAYFDRVMRSKWMATEHPDLARRYRLNRFVLQMNERRTSAWGSASHILLPPWSRCPSVILHEIAHAAVCAAGNDGRHGWEWAATFLRLVRHFVGIEAFVALRGSFKRNRVRYKAPKVLSDETRQAMAERLRQWRERQAVA